ncbi:hypothetical protein ACVWXO_001427 [Bradyrhizobium sp. LM2.7]
MPWDKPGRDGQLVPHPARPLTDMANEPSKKSFVYSTLSFRVYDWNCPRLDTEWLLSTLFDASLLSTFKAAGFPAALFCLAQHDPAKCEAVFR